MDVSRFALHELVEEVIDGQKLALNARNIDVERGFRPVTIEGDRTKLRVVIDNLLSNAIKYSPAGSSINVKLGSEEKAAVIDVIDRGAGIAAPDRERIFEPFFRGAATNATKGTGLGLAITRDLVEMHGGKVALMPAAAGAGAHFRVQLPLTPA
jgi:two-component system sensor histidine kinase GlrK